MLRTHGLRAFCAWIDTIERLKNAATQRMEGVLSAFIYRATYFRGSMTLNTAELLSMKASGVTPIRSYPKSFNKIELSCLRQGYRYGN
jgi:hypothetical protein